MKARAWIYGGLSVLVVAFWGALGPKLQDKSALAMTRSTPTDAPLQIIAPPSAPQPVQRPLLQPALRDPFVVAVASQQQPTPAPEPAPVAQAPAPQPPEPPPLNLRFAGRMIGPDGAQVIFAVSNNSTISLVVGTTLPNGYRVDQISDRHVELSYPPLNAQARLDIPTPPAFEIR